MFNFTDLDLLVHQLHVNGLKPGFELMGNPSGIFSDFENKTQVFLWKILVQHTAEHFIGNLSCLSISFQLHVLLFCLVIQQVALSLINYVICAVGLHSK